MKISIHTYPNSPTRPDDPNFVCATAFIGINRIDVKGKTDTDALNALAGELDELIIKLSETRDAIRS